MALIDYVQPLIGNVSSTSVILACTDLTPAFPEAGNKTLFYIEGLQFMDATSAHVAETLQAARRLTGESI
ncbi:MAG: hypothetical protein HKN43_05875 [Rhodothermales bacterium]|nr:hypothetical protein [Rhodothermales bacterium]